MSYIEFPRFAIHLTLDKKVIEAILNFYKGNDNLNTHDEDITNHGLHLIIKPPFYINDLNNVEKLISIFLNLKNEIDIPNTINFKEFSYEVKTFNNAIRLELRKSNTFDFFSNQVVRRFDEFRKVLNPYDYQKDISRFDKLTENQILNYQIWGHPYLFEETSYYVSILTSPDADKKNLEFLTAKIKKILHDFNYINLSKLSICKQSNEIEPFYELASIDL